MGAMHRAGGEQRYEWERLAQNQKTFLTSANLLSRKTFGFDLVLRKDTPPETGFRVLGTPGCMKKG
jgi:hypothetical protein